MVFAKFHNAMQQFEMHFKNERNEMNVAILVRPFANNDFPVNSPNMECEATHIEKQTLTRSMQFHKIAHHKNGLRTLP